MTTATDMTTTYGRPLAKYKVGTHAQEEGFLPALPAWSEAPVT